jgi:hypothetical protein
MLGLNHEAARAHERNRRRPLEPENRSLAAKERKELKAGNTWEIRKRPSRIEPENGGYLTAEDAKNT